MCGINEFSESHAPQGRYFQSMRPPNRQARNPTFRNRKATFPSGGEKGWRPPPPPPRTTATNAHAAGGPAHLVCYARICVHCRCNRGLSPPPALWQHTCKRPKCRAREGSKKERRRISSSQCFYTTDPRHRRHNITMRCCSTMLPNNIGLSGAFRGPREARANRGLAYDCKVRNEQAMAPGDHGRNATRGSGG
jgi:hypothetical protein